MVTTTGRWAALAATAVLAGCSPALVNTCADGYVFDATHEHCVPEGDGSVGDAGADGGGDVDAHVACGGACSGTTPHCLVAGASETCVGCTGPSDCSGATSLCDATSHTCVGCVDESSCTTAGASRCDAGTHACAACMDDGDCTHLGATGVCDAGTCVACSPANETACGANSCDPATRTCTSTPRGSVGTCRACAADSECTSAMDRCVPMEFMGTSHGSYCLRQSTAGCMQPYTVPTGSRASASGASAAVYCGVNETVTTCEAVQALIANTACTTAGDCGDPALDDGLCQTVNFVANRCTYACGGSSQCPGGFNCGGAGFCGSP